MFQSGPYHTVHYNWLFTLNVFTLSGLHCMKHWEAKGFQVSANRASNLICLLPYHWDIVIGMIGAAAANSCMTKESVFYTRVVTESLQETSQLECKTHIEWLTNRWENEKFLLKKRETLVSRLDNNSLSYKRALVNATHPGKDGKVRTVTRSYKNYKVGESVKEYRGAKDVS